VFLPRRWVLERILLARANRRLVKGFEDVTETLATFTPLASIQLAIGRLART